MYVQQQPRFSLQFRTGFPSNEYPYLKEILNKIRLLFYWYFLYYFDYLLDRMDFIPYIFYF